MTVRRLTVLIVILSSAHVMGWTQEPAFCETFVYDERVHDFGTIKESEGTVSHTFTFTNKGSEPVAISGVNLWCGCTKAEFSKQPVRPGQTTTVTLSYNPAYRPGKFSKEAVVLLNEGRRYTRVWVKGEVVGMKHPVTEDQPYFLGEGLYVSHQVIPFGRIQPGATDSVRLLIANGSDRDITIEFKCTPENRLLQLPRKLSLKAGEQKKIYAKYTARYTYDYHRQATVLPKVNGKETKPLRVTWLPND